MSLRKKKQEIQRLIDAFESEAAKFHDLSFSTFTIIQGIAPVDRKFANPNHTIMLWQYYGKIRPNQDNDEFLKNLQESDLQWGIRGAQVSSFGVIEGAACELFVRMAKRAGNLFNQKEAQQIQSRVLKEIFEAERDESSKPTGVTNDNVLAVWLNHLLYHISRTKPGREKLNRIEPDPFTLSLLALEQLMVEPKIAKSDRSLSKVEDINFKVALSFPGEKRAYVSKVVERLRQALGVDTVFYDYDFQSQLARPNLDTLLQRIYKDNSELVVVFLCAEYAEKEWCGLEWRAIRDIIKIKDSERIMFVRFDDANVDDVFSIDGYIDGNRYGPAEVANFILERLTLRSSGPPLAAAELKR
jgi:hypothetical protein